MIYLFYGTDTNKTRRKLHEVLEILKKKRPNAEIFRISGENYSSEKIEELFSSQGLFDEKYIVVLDGLGEKSESKEFILENFEELKNSIHPFLLIDKKVDQKSLEKLKNFSEKVFEFTILPKDESGIFAITKPLLERNKKDLWVCYLGLLKSGFVAEEIHGVIFWQVKNMILVSKAKEMKDAGLTPFQYKNALSGSRKYKIEELLDMSNNLVKMVHLVRTGKGDLEVMLEKWILML